jgi:hypothetical protein
MDLLVELEKGLFVEGIDRAALAAEKHV